MSNPIPHGVIGRTDQGVDISASPGAGLYDPVPGRSRLVGVIGNWFQGQPYYWFQVVSGPFRGAYWYVAEQVNIRLGRGSTVSQGQQIGTYAAQGTATEWGWAVASGATRARATTGYTEGQVTAAGTSFRDQIINRAARAVKSGPNLHVPSYVPPKYVNDVRQAAQTTGMPASIVAAQIQDESSFNPNSVSPTGAQGIAQFEPGTWKSYGTGSPFDPNAAFKAYSKFMSVLLKQYHGNIRDALAAYNAGSGNLAAGYGYADNILSKAGLPQSATAGSSSNFGGTRPGGQPANQPQDTGQSVDALFTAYETELNTPRQAPKGIGMSPFQWFFSSWTNNWEADVSSAGAGGAQQGQQAQAGVTAAGQGAAAGVASVAGQ